jgi:hypothetical protein
MTRRGPSLLLLIIVGCAETPEPSPDPGPPIDGGPPGLKLDAATSPDSGPGSNDGGPNVDAGLQLGTVVDTGRVFLDECLVFNAQCTRSTDPNCGKCEYRVLYDSRRCSNAHPCDELLLQFSATGCQVPILETTLLRHPELVVACVQPISPGEVLPSSLGSPQRDEAVVPRALAVAREAWNGKRLLLAGCSAGATRYPVVAARFDSDQAWLGSEMTAVCMAEGVVNIAHQDNFIGENLGNGPSCEGRHRRMITAYTAPTAQSGHACSGSAGGQCGCDPDHAHLEYPGDCLATGGDCVDFDSIVEELPEGGFSFASGVSAEDFAVQHWKLISEGNNFKATATRCEQDVVAQEPYQALCALLDADEEHTCVQVNVPDQPHCAYYRSAFDAECLDWFRRL